MTNCKTPGWRLGTVPSSPAAEALGAVLALRWVIGTRAAWGELGAFQVSGLSPGVGHVEGSEHALGLVQGFLIFVFWDAVKDDAGACLGVCFAIF